MIHQGDVVSYLAICTQEGVNLQRGMNFRLRGGRTVILMSLRAGAPYEDEVQENGRVLIYEGHDVPRRKDGLDPKSIDQPRTNASGSLTENGLFEEVALRYKRGEGAAERVVVYEKLRSGVWVYNGVFQLIDAWQATSGARKVFKFKLELIDEPTYEVTREPAELEHNRLIPSGVKRAVWRRDKGHCVQCGSSENLHFDHIIPYSKGGSSLVAENIQLLCARHNLEKRDRIE